MIRPSHLRGVAIGLLISSTGLFAQPATSQQAPLQQQSPRADAAASLLRTTNGGPAPDWLLDQVGLYAAELTTVKTPEQREPFSMSMTLEGEDYVFFMQPNDVRADSYKLLVDNGTELVPQPRSESVTWRGTVFSSLGPVNDGFVAVSIVDGRMSGLINLGASVGGFGIQSVQEFDATASAESHFVYHTADVVPFGECQVSGTAGVVGGAPAQGLVGGVGSGGPNLREAEFAFDCDREYYLRYGSSVPNVEARVQTILNGVDAIYINDVDITYVITTIIVRTTTTYTSTSAGAILNEFRNRWNSTQGGTQRDLAHLFSGKTTFGSTLGIASLSVVCNTSSAYGMDNSILSQITSNIGLVAHEAGHNWSAQHCNGTTGCQIMCSGLGGCGGIGAFGPNATTQILNFKASRSCLTVPPPPGSPPVVTSIAPSTFQAFGSGPVTLTGLNFTGINSLLFGLQPVIPTVLNDTTITFTPPPVSNLGSQLVIVTGPSGSSNLSFVSVTETNPPAHGAPAFAFRGSVANFDFGGGVNDTWFLLVNFNDPTTFPVLGLNLLNNPIGLVAGTLNNVGLGNFTLPVVSNPSLAGLQLRSQIVTIDDVTASLVGASGPALTSIF